MSWDHCWGVADASVLDQKFALAGEPPIQDPCCLFSVACSSPASVAESDELRGPDASVGLTIAVADRRQWYVANRSTCWRAWR